ncbi:MAG: queuosine precursor transporter [Bacteroidales bacterium]|nr:queuosine precursor transporter [Bacteroidales bacterium]MCB8998710.1 queuosine precursor transporter [Bacteroidales bacterium]
MTKANGDGNNKLNKLFYILSGVFLANVILADLIGFKIFSLTHFLGLQNLKLPFTSGDIPEMNMSVGILIWPFVFILSDIINEYFGRTGVQRISILAAIMVLYSSIIILVSTHLPPAPFWQELNSIDPQGNTYDVNFVYKHIFNQGVSIIAGSITAFLLSQFVDVYTFHWIRHLTGHKKLWLRATGSTVISQLIDSYVILTVAFYMMGKWSFVQVLQVGTIQYIYKVSFAILLTPLIYLFHYIIDKYLGTEKAEELIEETNENW